MFLYTAAKLLLVLALTPVWASAADDPQPPPKNTDLQVLRDAVSAKGRAADEVAKRFKSGNASKLEVVVAEAEWREAQIRLSEAEQNEPILILQLRGLVKLREEEREMIAARVKSGDDSAEALKMAEARAADAWQRLAKYRPPELAPPPRPRP